MIDGSFYKQKDHLSPKTIFMVDIPKSSTFNRKGYEKHHVRRETHKNES